MKKDVWLSKLVLSPSFVIVALFIYGFVLWTTWTSLTSSTLLPVNTFAGLKQYELLFANPRWWTALKNLGIFSLLYTAICLGLGVFLAVLLDQKIRAEGALRTIFLYPMALSFVVTGTAWKWILNPGLGIEKLVQGFGWSSFEFDWLVNADMAIYTVVLAGVWQSSGFVMAMFLAALRGIDRNVLNAAAVDGAGTWTIYLRVVIPALKPVFFSSLIILMHIAIKSFDLVMALTGGGPGYATDMPATFMYTYTFGRSRIGMGAASAVMMLMGVLAILIPYLYSELREKAD